MDLQIPLLPHSEHPVRLCEPHSTCRLCPLHQVARSVGINLHHHHATPPSTTRPAVLIVGQNPGYNEDLAGKPFVGKTGYVLHKSYIDGVSIPSLADIYFANAARCTSDHDPKPATYRACIRHTLADIQRIAPLHPPPLYILTLGAPATTHTWSLASISTSLSESFSKQGTPAKVEGHPVLLFSTFHPAAVLRSFNLIHAVSGHLQILLDHLTDNAPTPSTPTIVPARSPICQPIPHPSPTPTYPHH